MGRREGHAISYPEKPWSPLACADCGAVVAYMKPRSRKPAASPKVVCASCHWAEM